MIYFLLVYLLCGLGTALFALLGAPEGISKNDTKKAAIVWFLIWPVMWVQITYYTIQGHMDQRCAWCDKKVAPAHKKHLDEWRHHYLYECEKHPLTATAKVDRETAARLRRAIDQLNNELSSSIAALRCALNPTTPSDYRIAGLYLSQLTKRMEGSPGTPHPPEQAGLPADGDN